MELIVPPLIGLADNGDFGKVAGHIFLSKPQDNNLRYFVSRYTYSPDHAHWTGGLWYSEVIPAWIAMRLGTLGGKKIFDIRFLAAVHTAVFLFFYYLLLLLLRQVHRLISFAVAALVLWIFTDVTYTAYYNSFMSDTIAVLTLLLMVALALHIILIKQAHWVYWMMFAAAAVFFVTSKAQHGVWAIFPALFALLANWWSASRAQRTFGVTLCVLLLIASFVTLYIFPVYIRAQPLFDVVFRKLAADPGTTRQSLQELGLPEEYSRFVGLTTWSPNSPMQDERWASQFYRRVRPHIVPFYFSHPRRALAILHNDLRTQAPYLRPPLQANYRLEDGYPPFTLTRHFCSWSDLRRKLFLVWPEHILVWWALFLVFAAVVIRKGRTVTAKKIAAICLGLVCFAIGEFCLASLLDAVDTHRHLLLFHTATEISICLAVATLIETAIPDRTGVIGSVGFLDNRF